MTPRSAHARSKLPRVRQLLFQTHGGARRGAGRKPKGTRALVSQSARPSLAARHPVLVTCKRAPGLPNLRTACARAVLHEAFRSLQDANSLRLVHFSIQADHVHAIVEAHDAPSLSRGMQRLCIRIAQGLNRLWKHAGRVFADRFHARALRTPREVRHALAYVLQNARKHRALARGIDPFSSGAAFDGWSATPARAAQVEHSRLPVDRPRT